MGDFPLTTFSSEGKLLQIEYAINAVGRGETALGVKCKDGVILAVEKRLSSVLIDESSYHKIQNICDHVGAVYAGLGPDYRIILQKARKINMEYFLKYREKIALSTLSRECATVVQEFTQSGGVRPFGVSILMAGYDDEGPHLYQIDPSGAYYEWKATTVGKMAKNVKSFLEKRYKTDLSIEDGIHTALLGLKEGFEEKMTPLNVEIGVVTKDKPFRLLTPAEIKDYIANIETNQLNCVFFNYSQKSV